MSYLSENNRQDIEKLKDYYQLLSLDSKQFFPSKLSAAILRYQSGSENESILALELCRAFLNEEDFIKNWSLIASEDCLQLFSTSSLILAVNKLNHVGLLTGDLAQANFDTVAKKQGPRRVAQAFGLLNREVLLIGNAAQANFHVLALHENPYSFAEGLNMLHGLGILAGDIAQANFNAMAEHQDPCAVGCALYLIKDAGLLTADAGQAIFEAVVGHQYPGGVASALDILSDEGLLTADAARANLDAVARHQDSVGVARIFSLLNRVGLLTGDAAQANRDAVVRHEDFCSILLSLFRLNTVGLLTRDTAQDNFNALITHSAILFNTEITELWMRIPAHRLTQARFTALIEICQQYRDNPAAGYDFVIAHINHEILDLNPAAEPTRLNLRQSTHTASVHQTVSESATRLMVNYRSELSVERIQDLSRWLNAQSSPPFKVMVAKRCLQRLIDQYYVFIDSGSGVTTKQLLSLFWIAIHDDTRRMGTLENAKLQLIEGLYEMQREYNLSETGVDNGADRDLPSCPAGTFNKIIEKGHGVHPDMVVNFISMQGFSLKLLRVVREEAMAYLTSCASSNIGVYIDAIKAEANANSVGPIWAKIQAVVADRMFEEFHSLFGNDRRRPDFLSAIAVGEFCALTPGNLSELDRFIGQVSRDDSEAAAGVGAAPDGFFAAVATNGKTSGVIKRPHP